MSKRNRRTHDESFKVKVVLESLKEEKTLLELSGKYEVHPNQISQWRKQFLANATKAFTGDQSDEAINIYGTPEIFNTDQGSQFTSDDFIEVLTDNDIKISMDGKGRALDNVFVERLWRTVKYDNIFLNEYRTVNKCRTGLKEYFNFYNTKREHQSLDYYNPDEIYFGEVQLDKAT